MDKIILFAYLVLFPFGQLLKISVFNASDILAGFAFLYIFLTNKNKFKINSSFKDFMIISLFSLIYSFSNFESFEVLKGGLYLLRVVSYFYLYKLCLNIVRKDNGYKKIIFNSLLTISFSVAFFGWIQYFIFPDLTSLKFLGWDDHLFRLVGTYLDPGFTSLIIVFGLLIAFVKKKYLIFAFLIVSLVFTYSRAGYLAFIFSLFLVSLFFKKMRVFLISVLFFTLIILLLPNRVGEGVNLGRTYSIFSRVDNYSQTISIFKKSPVFGIGFNNFCFARIKYLGDLNTNSHSCFGSDSSLLLILATTGIVGLLIFIKYLYKAVIDLKNGYYSTIFLVLISAVMVHSLFVNSLFYPWVMGYLAIFASLREGFTPRKKVLN